MRSRNLLPIVTIVLVSLALFSATAATSTISIHIQNNGVIDYRIKYVVSKEGAVFSALNAATGNVDWTSNDASFVINKCIGTPTCGEVFIDGGTYLLYETITAPSNKIAIRGSGNSTILKLVGSADVDAIRIGGNEWVVADLAIDGNAHAGTGIYAEGKDDCLIENVFVGNCAPASFAILFYNHSDRNTVRNCYVRDCENGVVFYVNSSYGRIEGCTAENIGFDTNDDCFIHIANCDYGIIRRCVAKNSIADGASIYNSDYGEITDCTIDNANGESNSIDLHGTKHSTVSRNHINNTGAGILLCNGALFNNITENDIQHTKGSGIAFDSASSSTNNSISKNTILDCSWGYVWGAGIYLASASGEEIIGNVITRCGGSDRTEGSGIFEGPGCDYDIIVDNDCRENNGSTSDIYITGIHTIQQNNLGRVS
jgi:hypothetical protein